MLITYNQYFRTEQFSWPPEIVSQFRENSHFVSYIFIPQSLEEGRFIDICLALGLQGKIAIEKIHGCEKDDLLVYPMYYFATKGSDYSGPKFMDENTGCKSCRYHMEQRYKILLNPTLAKRLDIMSFWSAKQVWVVTRQAKELIQSLKLTGVNFIPCLRTDREYSNEEEIFGFYSEKLEQDAIHFQMLWNVNTPVQVGNIQVKEVCAECNAVRRFYDDMIEGEPPFILSTDLQAVDFQYFDHYTSSNYGPFFYVDPLYIISGKALNLLLSKGLRGIDTEYFDTPVIPFHLFTVKL